jgi:hypothetical protein
MPIVKISEEAHRKLKGLKSSSAGKKLSMTQVVNGLILGQKTTPIELLEKREEAFLKSWCLYLDLLNSGKFAEAKVDLEALILYKQP